MTTAELPRHRVLTAAEAAVCEAEYKRRWDEWMQKHGNNEGMKLFAYETHRAIWQGAYGAETITVSG